MQQIQRPIGIHLRIQTSLHEVMERAQELDISSFQSFISMNNVGQKLTVDNYQIKQFIREKEKFELIFFHASYKSNPSSCGIVHHYILEQEIRLALRLERPYLILHPGAAAGCSTKTDALDALARTLNSMQKKYSDIVFILENVAHGTTSIGGDIHDFGLLLPKLEYPERVQFCIDTAHAFCYGYDIRDALGRESFINLLETAIGIEKIVVLHINDTSEKVGSLHDQHAVLGKGSIGHDALRAFALHKKFAHIPLILEPPTITMEECKKILALVKAWHVL